MPNSLPVMPIRPISLVFFRFFMVSFGGLSSRFCFRFWKSSYKCNLPSHITQHVSCTYIIFINILGERDFKIVASGKHIWFNLHYHSYSFFKKYTVGYIDFSKTSASF